MTIYEIKERTKETAPYFFSRGSMKFFKQTMKDFKVYKQANGKFLIVANSWGGTTKRIFNPETNILEHITEGGR